MSDEKPAAGAAKPRPNIGKILGLGFAVLNLVVCGGGAFVIYTQTIGYQDPKISNQEALRELAEFHQRMESQPSMYNMDPLTTNLDGIPRRLVKVQMSLEMLDQEGFEEVINVGAGARDAIMRIMNATTYEDLETVQGKLQLKNQIIAQLNGLMKRGVVRQVYFSDLVVQ
jgi:flagellar FliL protein